MITPRLLLIENDPSLQSLLSTALTGAGYAVAAALPQDYLFMAQEIKPNIAILGAQDCHLNDDCWAIGELLHQTFPRLVLILLSTSAAVIDEIGITPRGRCFDAGLKKPFTIDQLLQVIACHYR